uniref:AlNc14C1G186 protein n=1 Tax=Albugo laibachii Nc14 TaxID=890382 RepID=F0VZ45_9STRA|nr:AlNc14C1G186 [Albugo laibachii Nc14]|eukprot:CCA14060.1 AlNc14C1G186 [Albugo laibachii Nc14]
MTSCLFYIQSHPVTPSFCRRCRGTELSNTSENYAVKLLLSVQCTSECHGDSTAICFWNNSLSDAYRTSHGFGDSHGDNRKIESRKRAVRLANAKTVYSTELFRVGFSPFYHL